MFDNYITTNIFITRKLGLLLILTFLIYKGYSANISNSETTKWMKQIESSIPDIPVDKGIAGAFIGIDRDVVIVAGGSYFNRPLWEGGEKIYLDSIFVLIKDGIDYQWKFGGILPYPVAHGAAVSTIDGVLCIGGEDTNQKFGNVFLLNWDADKQTVVINDEYAALPQASSYISASVLNNDIYVAGGKTELNQKEVVSNNFWKLNLNQDITGRWQPLESWPGDGRFGASLVTQMNGEYDVLFLFGGKSDTDYLSDAYMFDPNIRESNRQWRKRTNMPRPALAAPALAIGNSQVFVFSGSDGHDVERILEVKDDYRFTNEVLSYNTITDVWYKVGELQEGIVNTTAFIWDGQIVIPGGELRPGIRTPNVITASIASVKDGHFTVIDYSMMILYLALMALLGFYFSSRQKSSKDFFLGGKSIPFWAAALSMMATSVSSIGFMAIPAKSFATNWSYFAGVFTWFIVIPLVIYAFVPFYQRLNVTSVFEYLEARFNRFIRLFIASLYLLFQLVGRIGIIIFLPSIALSAVTGMSIVTCILIIGLLSTAYIILGGMHMVIWSDVIQAVVLFGGIILSIVFIIINIEGGVNEFINIAWNDNKFSLGSMDVNLTAAVFWVIIVGNIFNRIGMMSTDQSVVQKYLSTRDEKEMAKSLWADVAVSIPWAIFVFGFGTALYVFYKVNPDLIDPAIAAYDEVVPFFVGQNLPQGISGIIIAAIFAASMSSVDSSIHSSTTVLMRDFLDRNVGSKTELRKVALARWITGGLGFLGIVIALVMAFSDIASVWDAVLEIAGLFTGAITGVFILGIFSNRANGQGAVVGALSSAIILLMVKNYTALHFFLYSGIGIISCFVIGYLASFIFKSTKNIDGLTIYTVLKNKITK